MGYREAQELARIRYELRERLSAHRHQGVGGVLERLRRFAEVDDGPACELRAEYARWRFRFALLAHAARTG